MRFMGYWTEHCLRRLARWFESRRQFANDDVEHGREDKTKECDSEHSEEYGRAKGLAHLRAGAPRENQRNDAEDECKTRHQDRAQAKASRLDGSVRDAL